MKLKKIKDALERLSNVPLQPEPQKIPQHRIMLNAFERLPYPAFVADATPVPCVVNHAFVKNFGTITTAQGFHSIFNNKPADLNNTTVTYQQKTWRLEKTPLYNRLLLFTFTPKEHALQFCQDNNSIHSLQLSHDGILKRCHPKTHKLFFQTHGSTLETLFPNSASILKQFKSGQRSLALLNNFHAPTPRQGLLVYQPSHLDLLVVEEKSLRDDHEAQIQAQTLRSIGELAGGIAHDFNNYLTSMIGFCDLLLMRLGREEQSHTDVLQIKHNANRAAVLVRQLLSFSTQQTIQLRTFDLYECLAGLTGKLEKVLGPRFEYSYRCAPGTFLKADQKQLEESFVELATHAHKRMQGFACGHYRIHVQVQPAPTGLLSTAPLKKKNYAIIRITDTGQTIPEEDLPHVFDPFFTSHKLSKQGLGLATVYGCVQQLHGGIGVQSCVKETIFTMALPLTQAPPIAVKKNAASTVDALQGTGVILFVDDEDSIRLFSARALRNQGYRVIEAQNGQEALTFLQSNKEKQIDLIITDVVMPQMDGATLVHHVRKMSPHLKVIFISGYAEDAFRQQVGSNENIVFLPKPFSLQSLALIVKQTLHNSEEGQSHD